MAKYSNWRISFREKAGKADDELENFYGTKVVVYSTEEIWNTYLKGDFNENPIWIHNIFTTPRIEEKWIFWQYSNRGRLKGLSGNESFIDRNVFYGAGWR